MFKLIHLEKKHKITLTFFKEFSFLRDARNENVLFSNVFIVGESIQNYAKFIFDGVVSP